MYQRFGALTAFAALTLFLAPAAAADKNDKDENDPFADLIGKPAPDFSGDFFLNGKSVKISDLKGKVVLLDFWAVWCGPCVASFPELKEWHAAYKDKGLEVVGVTTYFQRFAFDKDGKKAVLIDRDDKDLTKDQEQLMLKDFVAYNELLYRILVMSKDDKAKVVDDYKVRAVPQVVLIDRKGVIRLVKLGRNDENPKLIREKIEELLGEKAE